ncbi:MAG TPA: hypothetical protein VLC08_12155 [Chitinolyticbacter sp.]|nr:hypothetical protein [Chitinolyticbacter sp.]
MPTFTPASASLGLMLPRGPERRHLSAQAGFPMITEEGLVLIERRSGQERRSQSEPAPQPEKPDQQ